MASPYNEFLQIVSRYNRNSVSSVDWRTLSQACGQNEEEDPTKVVSMDLCGNEIQSLEGLADYSLLVSLSVSQNQLLSLDGARLPFTLTHLDLSSNDISSLEGLNGLPHLLWLDCSHNRIDSLKPLSQCYRLRYLMASHNEISTVNGIEGLQKLERLQLNSNHISSMSEARVIATLTNLKHLALRGNPVARSPNFRLQLTHMMPGLYYLDREPLRSGPVHTRPDARPVSEKEKSDAQHEELVRMPFFNPPGTLDLDGNRLDDCEEVVDVDMAPEDSTRWLRYVFRDIAKTFGMTLEEIRDADFGEGTRGPGTLPMARKVQQLVDVQMVQLRMNKEARDQEKPEGVVEPVYLSPRKDPKPVTPLRSVSPGPIAASSPNASASGNASGTPQTKEKKVRRYYNVPIDEPYRASWSPGGGKVQPTARAMESTARHVDRIRIGRMMVEELDTPLSPGQVRSVVLPSLHFANTMDGPLSPEVYTQASRITYGRPMSAQRIMERSSKRVDDRWQTPPPGFEMRERYLTPSPGRTRTVSSYDDFKNRMSLSKSMNLEERKGRSLAGYKGWEGKAKEAPQVDVRPPTARDAEAYATHRDRVRIGKLIDEEEKSGRPLVGWHFTPSVDLSKSQDASRGRDKSPFWESGNRISNFSTSIHERVQKRLTTELSSSMLGSAKFQRSTASSRARNTKDDAPQVKKTPSRTTMNARSPLAAERSNQEYSNTAPAASPIPRRAENPTPKSASSQRPLSSPASGKSQGDGNIKAPLGRFTVKQENQRQKSLTPPATTELQTPPRTVQADRHAEPRPHSPLQPQAETNSPYNSYRIDHQGVAVTPPSEFEEAQRSARKSVVHFAEPSEAAAPAPAAPAPTVTVPTKPLASANDVSNLLNDSELDYIMQKAMAEPPIPAPAPGTARGEIERSGASLGAGSVVSPRELVKPDEVLAVLARTSNSVGGSGNVAAAATAAAAPAPAPVPESPVRPAAPEASLPPVPSTPTAAPPPAAYSSPTPTQPKEEGFSTPPPAEAPARDGTPSKTPNSIFRSNAPNTGIYAPVLGSSPLTPPPGRAPSMGRNSQLGQAAAQGGMVGSNPPLPRTQSGNALNVTQSGSPARVLSPTRQGGEALLGVLIASPARPAPGVTQPLQKTPSNELRPASVQYSLASESYNAAERR